MANVNISIENRTFKDLDLNFTAHPVKKDITKTLNEYAIVNSVKNLVLTNFYERPFQPEIGSNVRQFLFENVDNFIASQLENAIKETIQNFEPRVSVSKIIAVASPDENRYNVKMEFFIINQTNPVTITFFLERIR
jgi:phage baseplate assembly protein W